MRHRGHPFLHQGGPHPCNEMHQQLCKYTTYNCHKHSELPFHNAVSTTTMGNYKMLLLFTCPQNFAKKSSFPEAPNHFCSNVAKFTQLDLQVKLASPVCGALLLSPPQGSLNEDDSFIGMKSPLEDA